MKITILGCGSSGGVPLIGNDWGQCDPSDPRNRRLRVSILVEEGPTTILVDTSPDMREQLLACNFKRLDAVLFTHAHADHSHGIDELRSVNWLIKKPVEIYADQNTLKELETRFDYIFQRSNTEAFHKPAVTTHVVEGAFAVGAIEVLPFAQNHGRFDTVGYRFGDFAYSTDAKALSEASFAALKGVKTWVVDCIREEPHHTHSHLEQTLQWIERVKPERAYLTHMNETLDYAKLAAKLPRGVVPAHDGLVIEC
jgi:phosphoribosyl 1,2-cyclic phosphate phosphodiesterase